METEIQNGTHSTEALETGIKAQYQKARQKVREATQNASEYGNESWENTLDYTRKNPARSVGIAVAAGAALGALAVALFSRREKTGVDRLQGLVERGFEALNDAACDIKKKLSAR
jgi:ElaB/YqjD/DUF883 family membrane-anchored ribosome-binding protein